MEKKYLCSACGKVYNRLEDAIDCAQGDLINLKNKDKIIKNLEDTRKKIEADYYELKSLISSYNENIDKYSKLFEDENIASKYYLEKECSCGGNCCNKEQKTEKEYKKDTIEDFLTNLLGGIQF